MRRKNVRFVMRMTPTDSAAACVTMVCAYHGRNLPLDDVRSGLGGSRRGTSLPDLVEALETQGFDVTPVDVESMAESPPDVPVVVRWRWTEFIVVERIDGQRVDVVDPRVGKYRLDLSEFLEGAREHALVARPLEDFERLPRRSLPWRRYAQILRRRWGSLAKILGGSVGLQLLALVFPVLTALVVDEVIPNARVNLLWLLGLGLLAFVAVRALVSLVRQIMVIRLERALDRELVTDFFRHMLRLPLSFFEMRSAGDLLMQVNSNTVIRGMLSSVALSVVLDAALALVYLVLMFLFEPRLAIVVALLGLLQLAVTLIGARVQHHYSQRSVLAQSAAQSLVMEILAGIGTVKVAGAEARAESRWLERFEDQLQASYRQQKVGAVFGSLLSTVGGVSPMVLLVYGAYLVLGNELTLGQMLGFNALAGAFIAPLTSLGGVAQRMQMVAVHMSRLSDVLDAKVETAETGVAGGAELAGEIELRNASYRYGKNDPRAVDEVTLRVPPGTSLALVGATGSGKSTLVKMIAGLYRPTDGDVLIDGAPLGAQDPIEYRTQVGVVLQDLHLFQDTILENIRNNDDEVSEKDVERAAQIAAIHEDIMRWPLGYGTHLSEVGANISGGQRQRICIARALAHRPKILLLDEATSFLDALTERRVFDKVDKLPMTRVIVSHRLSTVSRADQIAVLREGRVVEKGSHRELLARRGLYHELWTAQFGSAEEPSLMSVDPGAVN